MTGPFRLGTLGGARGGSASSAANLKFYAAEYHSQAPVWAALELRKKLQGEEIEAVDVQTYSTAYSEIGSEPEKWNPRNRETADHSLPYLLAVALRDGRVTPAIFEPGYFLDPGASAAHEPDTHRREPGVHEGVSGRTDFRNHRHHPLRPQHVERTAYPKGHARNPMNERGHRAQIPRPASAALAPAQADAVLAFLRDLEKAPDVRQLLDVLTIPGRAS